MYRQAVGGPIDAITGDYLAEFNLALNAEAMFEGNHPGYEPTAWDGIEMSIEEIAKRKIKLVINGGALNPKGLAIKTYELARAKGLDHKVSYVLGDDPYGAM